MKTISINDILNAGEARIKTGVQNFDSFLGGGFVDSQCILLAGEPGAGKSTLLLQLSTALVDRGQKILYFSGEESLGQTKLRANRIGALRDDIICSEQMELNEMFKILKLVNPKFIIIDSLQMVYSDTIIGEPGSPKQTKACLEKLRLYVKKTGQVLIVIGHANKGGKVAGVLTLQHMVDSIFFITVNGNKRTMGAIKNRFGAIDSTYNLTMQYNGFWEFHNPNIKPKNTNSGLGKVFGYKNKFWVGFDIAMAVLFLILFII